MIKCLVHLNDTMIGMLIIENTLLGVWRILSEPTVVFVLSYST